MKKIINIDGMSCGHCKLRVENVLMSIDGVESAEVSLDDKNAVVQASKTISNAVLEEAILDAGFDVENIIEI